MATKARLDALFAKSTIDGGYGCAIGSRKNRLHRAAQTRHLVSKQAAPTLGLVGQVEVGANRLRGNVRQHNLLNTVMDQNEGSGVPAIQVISSIERSK